MLRHNLQVVNIDNNNNISWLTVGIPSAYHAVSKVLKNLCSYNNREIMVSHFNITGY